MVTFPVWVNTPTEYYTLNNSWNGVPEVLALYPKPLADEVIVYNVIGLMLLNSLNQLGCIRRVTSGIYQTVLH